MKKAIIFWIVGIVVLVVLALVLSHRGSEIREEQTPQNQTSTSQNQTSSDTNTQSQSSNGITIKDMAFTPSEITVKKGTLVTWTNMDSVEHNITKDSGDGPASDNLSQGEAYSFKFENTGTFKYHCGLHPTMTGTVIVTE